MGVAVIAVAAVALVLLWPRIAPAVESVTTDWNAVPLDKLQEQFAGKLIREVPPAALQRLMQHAIDRVNAGPQGEGLYGEKLLTPVPGQNVSGQVFYFFRWPASERLRDMAPLIDRSLWANPAGKLYLAAIKGQPKYGFIDKAAGDIKRVAGATLGTLLGGPAGGLLGAGLGGRL